MGNCLSKKKPAENSMGSSFSSSKGSSIEVAKRSENLSLIQNDQNSGPKETTLKTIKQQHMENVLDSAEQMIENESFSKKPVIKLLPHQHTLFCERKVMNCLFHEPLLIFFYSKECVCQLAAFKSMRHCRY